MFLLRGNWGEGQGAPPGAADEIRRNLCQCLCPWPPGPQLPQRASVRWLLWARHSLLAPPDTVLSLGYHNPPAVVQGGQEGVNATRKGLWGRKKAVPTRLRCQGERPALMGHSRHYQALAGVDSSVWEAGAALFCLPHGAPWHPGPPASPWPSARPGRARRAAGAGLTMHHRALCVLALGTLGKGGGGGPAGMGGWSASGVGTVQARGEEQRLKAGGEEREVGQIGYQPPIPGQG